jgi:antitoxin (DNA-binding transcriptional repressor) of toxin-antitoxin stability system
MPARSLKAMAKRGKPVAKLVPVELEPRKPLFGYMAGTINYVGDIESPIDVEWEVLSETEPNFFPGKGKRRAK